MTKEKLWEILTNKNPHWTQGGANFTAAGLEKFFDVIWQHAHKAGVDKGVEDTNRYHEALDRLAGMDDKKSGVFGDVFGDIFGDTKWKK